MKPTQEIITIEKLLETKLTIPNYQRPYKWNKKTVEIFLKDIYKFIFVEQKRYRLGTLIIHRESDNKLNIVDGQQRITTLFLILNYLNHDFKNQEYLNFESVNIHPKTVENIKVNYAFIHNWFSKFKEVNDIEEYKKALLENCEFVKIEVTELNSAFQLFDSQNTRGKALNPEDLLKAFHLQKMTDTFEIDKIRYVEKWERLATTGQLTTLFGEHLYRIRNWAKGEPDYYFNKDEIQEFKGIDVENFKYNYSRSMAMNLGLIDQMKNNKVNQLLNISIDYPFMITQKIINGENFFEYVFYFEIFFTDVINNSSDAFKAFYNRYCKYYHFYRTGDYYVRNFYENLLVLYANHFNKGELELMYKAFYKYSYEVRLSKKLNIQPVLKKIKIFEQIDNSYEPTEFSEYVFKKYPVIQETELAKGLEEVKIFITENK